MNFNYLKKATSLSYLFLMLATLKFQATPGFAQNENPTALTSWPNGNEREETLAMMDFLELPGNTDLRPAPVPNLPENETVLTFETLDQHILEATYAHTPLKQNAPLAIILHDQNEDRQLYADFARSLRMAGISTITVDLRGYGGSTKKTDGSDFLAVDFQTDNETNVFREMGFDVDATLNYIYDNKMADENGVFIIGSVLGSSVACMSGVRNANRMDGIIMVSPYLNFRGIDLKEEIGNIQGLPMLAIISENDRSRRSLPTTITKLTNDAKARRLPGHEMGFSLIKKPEAVKEIIDFIKTQESYING